MAAMNDPPISCPSGFDVEQHRDVYQHGCGDILNEFKRLVVQLADSLADEDSRGKIRYLCKDRLCQGGEKMKTLEIFEKLEEKGVFSARNVHPLEHLLRSIDRCDLIEAYLEPYQRKYPTGSNQLVRAEDYYTATCTYHRSKSLPNASRQQTSPSLTAAHPHSTSHPVPITATQTSNTGPTSDLPSIQEEHQSFDDRHSHPCAGALKKSMYVFGKSTSVVNSGEKVTVHCSHKNSLEGSRSVQSTNSTCSYFLSTDKMGNQDKQITEPSVNMANDCVTFQVGGDVGTPSSTLPRDVDSQLTFPMENNAGSSPGNTPSDSKLNYPAQGESLASALTRSFNQADERLRTNTPLLAIDKPAVEATDDRGASVNPVCVVTGQKTPLPHLSSTATAIHDRGSSVRHLAAAVANGAVNIACATLSLQNSTPDRTWQSKPKSCTLHREKMAVLISKQKTSYCYKRFTATIPISKSRKNLTLNLEVYPCGRDGELKSRHLAVLVHFFFPSLSTKCRELTENCNSMVDIQLMFIDSSTQEVLSKVEDSAELCLATCKGYMQIDKALSHECIFYRKTQRIHLQVEAVLTCRDKIVAGSCSDPDCADYLLVQTNRSGSEREEELVSKLKEVQT